MSAMILLMAFATVSNDLLPVPAGEELAKAEKTVQEVFGKDLAAAKKPADKVAVARRMIETAEGSSPAEKHVLLTQARELAIAAGDAAAGIRAVEELVSGFASGKTQDAATWASEGHRLWSQAGKKRASDMLRMRLEAAECYLRALDGLEGFERTAAEKRLRGLGWRVGPIAFEFDESTEGWEAGNHVRGLVAREGCLTGRVVGGDPHVRCRRLSVRGSDCPDLEIRFAIASGTHAEFYWTTTDSPAASEDKRIEFPVRGDGQQHCYRLNLGSQSRWAGKMITSIRIDPGAAAFDTKLDAEFAIDYVRGGVLP